MSTSINTNEIKQPHAPRFTPEQKEAWQKAKELLKTSMNYQSKRALHIAMSQLRLEGGRKHRGPIEALPKNETKLQQHNAEIVNIRLNERVAEWKEYLTNPGSRKLYIIVSPDLDTSQSAVQASHCAADFVKQHPLAPWINGTMVLLTMDTDKIKGKNALEIFCNDYFWYVDYKTCWKEPDQDNRITAVAMLCDFGNDRIGKQRGVKLL